MGLFVSILIDKNKCRAECSTCIEVCPVDIFTQREKQVIVSSEDEDECTLCNLCLEKCPAQAIVIQKNY
jgi:DNA-directed RNA polymerase subunit D